MFRRMIVCVAAHACTYEYVARVHAVWVHFCEYLCVYKDHVYYHLAPSHNVSNRAAKIYMVSWLNHLVVFDFFHNCDFHMKMYARFQTF